MPNKIAGASQRPLIKIVAFPRACTCIELLLFSSLPQAPPEGIAVKSDGVMTMHKDAQRISYKW